MKFTNTLTNFFFFGVLATFATLFSLVSAAPVDVFKRDVFVPPITYPHAGTVWAANSHHNVTWVCSFFSPSKCSVHEHFGRKIGR